MTKKTNVEKTKETLRGVAIEVALLESMDKTVEAIERTYKRMLKLEQRLIDKLEEDEPSDQKMWVKEEEG